MQIAARVERHELPTVFCVVVQPLVERNAARVSAFLRDLERANGTLPLGIELDGTRHVLPFEIAHGAIVFSLGAHDKY